MITLKPGIYTYDVGCKNGKDHIFDSQGNMIFEANSLVEIFEVFHFNHAIDQGFKSFKYIVPEKE